MSLDRIHLVVLDYLELPDDAWQRLRDLTEVVTYDTVPQTEAEILDRLGDADGVVVTSVTALSASVLSQLPQLRCIIVPGVGMDHIDLAIAQAQGIEVINCPTYNANAVAEFTIGLMFAIARHIPLAHQTLATGHWQPQTLQGRELSSQHLVVIGAGTIGQAVAQKAIALGMQVSTATSKTSPDELDTLIAAADFLSLHLSLTQATHNLLNARRLALMKPTAYLINTARGGTIDSEALLATLEAKQIAGAALDVFENEPTTGQPNETILALAQLDNVITTPHIAYNTDAAIRRLGEELVEKLEDWLGKGVKG
ncbi:MAG: 2-hydroxyacid dehydrogenase [Cyanobacteria bacterium P01_G01_bin.38]